MNPKSFLKLGGVALLLLGVLGFLGIIGPTPEQSVLGTGWWFDNGENWAHFVLGAVALLAAWMLSHGLQKLLVRILGIVGVLVGLYSLLVSTEFLGSMLQNPGDTLLHLVVGVWALWAASGKPRQSSIMQ